MVAEVMNSLFQVFWVQWFEVVDNEEAVLANQFTIKVDFASAVFRGLDHHEIPVDRTGVSV